MQDPDMSHGARLTAYGAVSTALDLCSDRALRELVDTALPLGSGIGGTSALAEVAGTPVFVKRVPLTDLEREPENVRSTANLFELPSSATTAPAPLADRASESGESSPCTP